MEKLEMEIKRFRCECGCELFLIQKWRYVGHEKLDPIIFKGFHKRGERSYWCLDCRDYTHPKWVEIPNNGSSNPIVADPSKVLARLYRMKESLLEQKIEWIEREAKRLESMVNRE